MKLNHGLMYDRMGVARKGMTTLRVGGDEEKAILLDVPMQMMETVITKGQSSCTCTPMKQMMGETSPVTMATCKQCVSIS